MEPRTFFSHYLPALAEALRHDDIREAFFVKGPDYYFGEDNALCRALEEFIDTNIDDFPIFDRVGLYFDAIFHGFPSIEGMPVRDYRLQLQQEATALQRNYELV